jgi:hypothetical protein
MPRIALRYAIEKFEEDKRRELMKVWTYKKTRL